VYATAPNLSSIIRSNSVEELVTTVERSIVMLSATDCSLSAMGRDTCPNGVQALSPMVALLVSLSPCRKPVRTAATRVLTNPTTAPTKTWRALASRIVRLATWVLHFACAAAWPFGMQCASSTSYHRSIPAAAIAVLWMTDAELLDRGLGIRGFDAS